MSGGHFDYKEFWLGEIADSVEDLIKSNDDTTLDDFGYERGRFYSHKTLQHFQEAVNMLRTAYVYIKAIDYLVSCDDGEDTFLDKIEDFLDNVEKDGE